MKDISVTDLRNNLQAFLTLVRRGRRFRITSRGKVIAEISPPGHEPRQADAARQRLLGSVLRYDEPTKPAFAANEWDMHR